MIYTAVTFAPVQGFIMASRKLRDLYGSSLLLSHLACAQTRDAEAQGLEIVSPADVKGSRGVPNVLVIKGDYSRQRAEAALLSCWGKVLEGCRTWIEHYFSSQPALKAIKFDWHSSWRACELHSWEMFHGQGATIQEARKVLAITKQQRSWAIPNWTGESSTLSSAEAVVRPTMGTRRDPRTLNPAEIQKEAREFLQALCTSSDLGEAFAGANEEISIAELVKRLITYRAVAKTALATEMNKPLSDEELKTILPERFQQLTNRSADTPESIIWFMADGDGIGGYLESLAELSNEEEALRQFTGPMREWAASLYQSVPEKMPDHATVVYAGGDDLFGALHESEPGQLDLTTDHLWTWLQTYQKLWSNASKPDQNGKPQLTVSMGLVWADRSVPQREALQHAREAEASAKARGKNRFALRLVYANGNSIEWTCPWSWLEPIRSHYTDREGRKLKTSRDGKPPNWRHLAEDLQWLQSRQAIAYLPQYPDARAAAERSCVLTARTLWDAYFPGCQLPDEPEKPGQAATSAGAQQEAPAARPPYRASFAMPEKGRRFDQWLWDLGRVMAGLEKYSPAGARIAVRL
jgi:CRISPR-associated protein Cmr2